MIRLAAMIWLALCGAAAASEAIIDAATGRLIAAYPDRADAVPWSVDRRGLLWVGRRGAVRRRQPPLRIGGTTPGATSGTGNVAKNQVKRLFFRFIFVLNTHRHACALRSGRQVFHALRGRLAV